MILFLDVDGTLINYQGILPESARLAVNQARANGHKVYICTGCSKAEIEDRKWNLELDGMIGGNGCYIESNQQVIFHNPLTIEECKHFVDWCSQKSIAFRLECNDGIFISEDYLEKSLEARIKYSQGNQVSSSAKAVVNESLIEGEPLIRSDVNKGGFVLRTYQDYLDAVTEFEDLKIGTWGGKGELALYGDISRANTSKANAIKQLLAYLNADIQDTIAFGDAKIDIPMFEVCGYSVAMGNAGDECKAAADYISDDVDNDGLLKAFRKLNLID